MIHKRTALAALTMIAASAPAHADVTISTAATQNMSCSSGTCVPTATNAVLNATDLENDLTEFGNVRVMTTGSGVEANNIVVKAAFTSPDSTSLTFEAHKAITVAAAVSIGAGTAELELQSDTLAASDTPSFGRKGHITFGNLSDIFGINGGIFTLVGSVQGLAAAVAANPSGSFALANSYDARQDGTYSASPVATAFMGALEGLGNFISGLSIKSTDEQVALVGQSSGTIENLYLTNVRVVANRHQGTGVLVGGLVATNDGILQHVGVSGNIEFDHRTTGRADCTAGGLAGSNSGEILLAWSTASVFVSGTSGYQDHTLGGLVGVEYGSIEESFATGNVSGDEGFSVSMGGLVGVSETGGIENSYAIGTVGRGTNSVLGGLVGRNYASGDSISSSYSTGAASGDGWIGGFAGENESTALTYNYWDTTTSGTSTGVGHGSESGVAGLTTQQLQSGLPAGFDPKVWAENSNINGGLPYLIANPPPK